MSLLLFILAQAASPPPPVAVPNVAADTRPLGDPRKFFLFHQPGISLEQARADFTFCARYLETGQGVLLPAFHPWEKSDGPGSPAPDYGGQYGLTGLAIGAIIDGPLIRSKRQINQMRCMLPRGYVRHQVSEGLWKDLAKLDLPQLIEVQAQLASGPALPTPVVP